MGSNFGKKKRGHQEAYEMIKSKFPAMKATFHSLGFEQTITVLKVWIDRVIA
jgi:hypothetical protein